VEEEVQVDLGVLKLTEFITVQELADKLQIKAQELIGHLFKMGIMATINQRLEKDNIELLAAEYEREVEFLTELGEDVLETEEVKDEDKTDRPPVVTVMGHVDHGKTSLLDRIRKTNVIAGEAGGITQHIGAYTVQTDGGPITFLDTPGHAAFTAMRARGAQVTDIVILIVAANDGVMPQTVEAVSHAKAAGVPIIVAVNKIDLPDATPDRVKQELLQHEIVVEEFGGDVLCAEISAKQGLGIDKLLSQVHLQAEVLELKAGAEGPARGIVVEAKKEPGRGVLFTVLVDQGTMKVGDNFLVGLTDGKVRALLDERGNSLESVKPGEPCEILGAHDVPEAGDRFYVVENERQARELADKRRRLQRQQQIVGPKQVIDLDNLAALMTTGELKELPIIIKGDVAGSVEALADQLMELNTDEVQVKIVLKAVGAVSESDVLLAANTGAMIIGFHMRPGPAILEKAKANNVTIEVFDIIYEAVDTLKKAMAGLLGSIQREVSTGTASVRQVFRIPKVGSVAGSMVIDGLIKRNSMARLIRDEVMIWEGKVNSLKRFKDDVKEVQTGYECGIGLENFYEIQEGDTLECYEIEEIQRTEL
jgi:translation initiation factor IF-2